MTTISILSGDFEILFEDETTGTAGTNAGMRMVRRTSGASTTVYTTNALYSAIATVTDDFIAMGFLNPMLPVTPNAYTMENNFFIPKSSTEYLKEGAITADWSLSVPQTGDTDGHGVLRKVYTVGLGTDFVAGDIGRQITDGTDEGTLLDYEVEPDGTLVAWIRPNDSTPATGDIFDLAIGTLEVTTDGGTGTVDLGAAATSGVSEWAAIQAIGSVPTATEVYVYQDRIKLADSVLGPAGFQWWETDPTLSLGIISILVRTINSGTTIADGDVEVFSRRYTSLYDNFRLNVAAGGFSALPLASAPDINNTTGYRRVTEVGATGTGTFVVGEIADEAVSGASVVITAVGGTGATPILQYYIVGDLTDLFASGAQTLTGATSGATMTTAAPVANLLGPTDTNAGEGGTVTVNITNGGYLVDHTGNNVNEPYSVEVDALGPGGAGVAIAKVYERIKYITRRGADEADLFGAGVNVPGESYRGLDGIFEYDADGGASMTEGDDVLTTTGLNTWTARLLSQQSANPVSPNENYITVTDQQTSIDSVVDDNVIEDETGGMQTVTVHAVGTLGFTNFTSPKSSPLGTFTGTQIFGARGVAFVNPAAADTQAYILTDDLGTLNNPPNTVTFTVENTVAGDRVMAARDNGTVGVISKDEFGGVATPAVGYNNQGDVRLRVGTTLDYSGEPEIPAGPGWVRVVENTLLEEHRYRYSALDNTDEEFDLLVPTVDTGTTTGGTSTTNIIDAGELFSTGAAPVVVGDLVRNTTALKTSHVWEVTAVADGDLDVVTLYGPLDATQDWDTSDTYEINKLIQTYANTDDLYAPYLDVEATSTSESQTFVKSLSMNFGMVVQVRRGVADTTAILPYKFNATVNDSGGSATVVRALDTIKS